MVQNTCEKCGSNNIVMNGKQANGKQKYHCRNCNSYRTFDSDFFYSDKKKEEILKTYKERSSLRGLTRIFGVSRTTVISWLKKKSQN